MWNQEPWVRVHPATNSLRDSEHHVQLGPVLWRWVEMALVITQVPQRVDGTCSCPSCMVPLGPASPPLSTHFHFYQRPDLLCVPIS